MKSPHVSLVIGAGPAGLTAAHELTRLGATPVVVEAGDIVGGISQTDSYKGYRFDIGGHRFFTKVESVQRFWEEMLGDQLLVRPRLSRIYYGGKFFDYPLNPVNALIGLGPVEAVRIGLSYLAAQLRRSDGDDRTFEDWVSNRFGNRLYEIFFKSYTEKVWGIPCSEIDSEWAAQRIKDLDLTVILKNMLGAGKARSKGEIVTTLIDQFHYPRLGPGQMWERCVEVLSARGVEIHMRERVERIVHDGKRIQHVVTRGPDGSETIREADSFISSMPIRDLIHAFDPVLPKEVSRAADQLRYRDFLTVGLIVDQKELFPDNWIYIHSDDVKVGRIQNFKNWSPEMVPDPERTSLGLEYFVQEADDVWCAPDAELIELARRECAHLGLLDPDKVIDGTVIRMPKAYPVYDGAYRDALEVIRSELANFGNLQLVGRNGQHRYNNQDHSMVTGTLAAQNIASGAEHDIWSVNVEADYHEEIKEGDATSGDRLVPRAAAAQTLEEQMSEAFARFDPLALGGATAIVSGAGLLLATVILMLRDTGDGALPMLSLLGNYFLGFDVSWSGALVGMIEAGIGGGLFGWTVAHMLNGVIAWEQRSFVRRVERSRAMDLMEGDP